ncbi:hypothetical protein AN641_03910 [Candidatus Epulonipiscioides gigas]|nr:hypothetical protein AN641_03910 [Epulopiscium sp. SCG-C07WGA-EpuloA2]
MSDIIKNSAIKKNKPNFFTDYSIVINKNKVFRSLDCHEDSPVYETMEEIYYELIEDIESMLDVTASYYIEDIKETYVIQELQDCEQIIYSTATIGSKISEKISKMFAGYEQMEAMILDAIATSIIMEIGNQLHSELYKYISETGLGAIVLAPGEHGADITYQTLIKNKMGDTNNVDVTESFLLEPIKSSSRIYGLKKGIPVARELHNCKKCQDKTCKWRQAVYVD